MTKQEAYQILGMMQEKSSDDEDGFSGKMHYTAKEKKKAAWDAPVNVNAFAEREVLQYVEDHDGTVLGN